jgi:hypothetical protein
MQVVIFKQENGVVAVMTPAPEYADQIEAVAEKDVPEGQPWKIIEANNLPRKPQEEWVWEELV